MPCDIGMIGSGGYRWLASILSKPVYIIADHSVLFSSQIFSQSPWYSFYDSRRSPFTTCIYICVPVYMCLHPVSFVQSIVHTCTHFNSCKNKQCILSVHICDGEPHCSDGSDELECSKCLLKGDYFLCFALRVLLTDFQLRVVY